MNYTKSPHLLFRRILDILDDLRRDSIKALNSPAQRKALGLTVRQGSAISQLRLMLEDEPKGVALKDLAKRMQMTVPAASLMVDSMVSKGFMERNTNPADRRAICIKLTEKGMELFNEVYAHFHEEIDRRAKALTADEMHTLAGVVEKLQHG